MVRVDKINGIERYVVVIPEESLYQPENPDTGKPFVSQADAEAWQAKFTAAKPKPAPVIEPDPIPEIKPIDVAALSQTDVNRMILEKLGYPVK
jgi:hypothetical protein